MGSGLSHIHRSSVAPQQQPSSARVIAADGSLTEFATSSPVSASDVLAAGNAGAGGPFFMCSSDALYFDEDVPALGGGELLRPGQIYFLLPQAMRGRPLSSADMVAMAVRASEALAARARPRGCARGAGIRKVRVTPVHAEGGRGDVDAQVNAKLNERTLGEYPVKAYGGLARIGKKADVAAFSPAWKALKLLTTIEEDAE